MKPKGTHSNRFLRVISLPYRALCKARDFYVHRIIDCTNSNVVGLRGASQAQALPRSFSRVSSTAGSDDSEDFRELVRAASANWRSGRLDAEMKLRAAGVGEKRGALPPRSVSVGMGRIDEERPISYFGEEGNGNVRIDGEGKKKNDLRYPRSKSHAAVVSASF